jgi:hypothetical protein
MPFLSPHRGNNLYLNSLHPAAYYSAVPGFSANPAYTLPHSHRTGHYDVSLTDGSAHGVLHIPNTQAVSAPVGH